MAEPTSPTYAGLEQKLEYMQALINGMNAKIATDETRYPSLISEGIKQISVEIDSIRKAIKAQEDERRSLRALSQIGQVVNSTLELDIVLQIVMDTIIRLTKAERGFLMLRDDRGVLATRIARNWEQESLPDQQSTFSTTVVNEVATSGKPLLTTNAQQDPRFVGQESVIAFNLRSIMCVPLKIKNEITGVIYTDNRIKTGLFSTKDLDLLSGFANQAAFAIENARLFESVRNSLSEVTELKNIMDNVFASIASGVITTNRNEEVLICNKSAEAILGKSSEELIQNKLSSSVPSLFTLIQSQMDDVLKTNTPSLGLEVSPRLPPRGQVDLRLSLSPLKDAGQTTQGVAIVIDDLTERKWLEAKRRLFERMVAPAVIEQIDPNGMQLGGKRSEISILFADIRGFTALSETTRPEELVDILNQYLAVATDAILSEGGTIDKFLGDAVMAWFNAPIPQKDHVLRSVKAALAIRSAVNHLHQKLPEQFRLSFGIGLHSGEALLGLVGTEKRMDYTAIGDSVNTAKRIQENTSTNKIYLSKAVYDALPDYLEVRPVDPIQAKGKKEPIAVFELIGMLKESK